MLKEILVTKAKDYPRDERANIAVEANIGGVSLLTAPGEHRIVFCSLVFHIDAVFRLLP